MAHGMQRADVCIICALEEEANAVEQVIGEDCQVVFGTSMTPDGRFIYRWTTILNNKQEKLVLALLCQTRPGPVSAALDLGALLEQFQPCFVGMSGTCAGDKRHMHLGDLVVAEHAYHFEEGKVTRDQQGTLVHQPEGITYGPREPILQYVRTFEAWETRVAKLKKGIFHTDEPPRRVITLMASGMAVRSDDPFDVLQRQHRKTWALDMEAAAFYLALHAMPFVDGLVVKGVCDYANLSKDDAFHDFAARASAIYLLTFIQEYVTNKTMPRGRRTAPLVFTVPSHHNPFFTERAIGANNTIPLIPPELKPRPDEQASSEDFPSIIEPRQNKENAGNELSLAFHTYPQEILHIPDLSRSDPSSLTPKPSSTSGLPNQNRIRMLRQVRTVWIDGLLTQSLHHAVGIELSLQDRPDVLANPWRLQVQELDQAPKTLPDGTTIVQAYDKAEGELLILGAPGAGKTTLLLELVRTLLDRAEKNERLRMPMVFNLSSWAEKRQSLRVWLVEELSTKYQVPRKIGQSWIDTDQVLPLLDGLDEVAKEARSTCVEQINDYYQSRLESGNSPIVVCCRSEEYAALSTRVMLQHAVSILPLTDGQINIYLEQAGEQGKGPRQALDEDAELYDLVRQPLMLNIFALAYQGARASEVPARETREETRHALFARYVKRMLCRRKQPKRWKPEQMVRWLTFLAKQMQQHDQTVFSVENLQPIWLSRRWRILYQWCVGLVVGLVFGLVNGLLLGLVGGLLLGLVGGLVGGLPLGLLVGLDTRINSSEALSWSWKKVRSGVVNGLVSAGLLSNLVSELIFRLVGGLAGGLLGGSVGGLLFGLTLGLDIRMNPAEALSWSWKKARHGLVLGLVGGLLFGLVNGLVNGRLFGVAFRLACGLAGGVTGGLFSGLSERYLLEPHFLFPNEGIWHSGKTGLVGGLISGLTFFGMIIVMLGGLLFERLGGLLGELLVGLVGGLLVGLLVGLTFGLGTFVKHFILRFLLSQRGNLPWYLIAFLDEAAERLLLRKVGGSYIFVHRLLLNYFADLGEKDDSRR